MAGRLGSLFALLGILLFFLGLFTLPRMFVFAGIALILASFAAYFIEEFGPRRS